ncbi:ribonuclease III domain-containing protein [Scenedesmus sp. NREL 46B-D3]|nr:ribonuclease III domain-containing protein [Scenedesmus sp. NREL 46B-D3]
MRSLHRAGLLTRSSTAVSRSLLACKAPKPTPPVPTRTVRLSKGICRVAGLSSSSSSSIHPSTTASAPLGAPAQRKRLNPAAYAEAYSLDGSTCLHSPGRDSSSLQQLQEFLGYHFRKEELLAQACTHSADKQALSYRQLAFVGDAALWMLFAEHAFHKFGEQEDPISGGWPACMSGLLSRASCAATARQWELHRFLQHSSSSSSSASRSSSASSSRSSGMTNGQWSTDTLAEMFEGVVGALLLDSDYSTVQQLLKPWVTESFEAARAADAAKAAVAAGAVTEFAGNQQQQQHQHQKQ